ncbi:glycosyltransferase [Glutamicibacter sp. NPDC127525]|uniref:glycosyltransferase n=1 Tax=unclassified Glutamicibacter TaxID=2627139 RepID=UPI00362BEBB5
MRLLMIAPGTRGDVAPMAGLGQKLALHGFDVSIAANPAYKDLAVSAGCRFRELPGDMGALVKPAAPGAKASPKDLRRYLRELRDYFELAATGTMAAAERGADIIMTNAVAPYAYDVAEAMGIPAIGAHLQPIEPSAAYSPMALGASRSFGPLGNKLLGQLFAASKAPYDLPAKRVRESLGLPARSRAASERLRRQHRSPILHGFSSVIVPRSADWHEGIVNCGYWGPPADPAWTPSQRLLDFIDEGPAPVFIGFGSTQALEPDFITDVARRTGRRTIVQGEPEIDEPGILGIGAVPHHWLFPQMAAVVHHAGAGITAAGLRAGVPAVPVPVFTDQPFWAQRIHRLGAAAEPIAYKHLTAQRLASSITGVLANEDLADGARRIARQLAAETDSSIPVIRILEQLGARHRPS